MKKCLLILLLGCLLKGAYSQVLFEKAIGDTSANAGNYVALTADHGYVIAGSTGGSNSKVYLVKTDSLGDVSWTKTYQYTVSDTGASVEQTFDGGYIICAIYQSSPQKIYLIKTNSFGDTLWTRSLQNSFIELGHTVHQTSDSGYAIASVTSDGANYVAAHLTKLNSAGNLAWSKKYCFPILPDFNSYITWDLKQLPDKGFIMTGYSYITTVGSMEDMLIIRTDSAGTMSWNKVIRGAGTEYGYSVSPTSDHGFIVAGKTNSWGAGNFDVLLVKLDSAANVLWTRTYGGASDDDATSVIQTSDGGYIFAGTTASFGAGMEDVFIVKTDTGGFVQWSRTFGGVLSDRGGCIQKTADGGYVVTGTTYTYGYGNGDVYLVKMDSAGNSVCNQANPSLISATYLPAITAVPISTGPGVGSIVNLPWTAGSGGAETLICTSLSVSSQLINNDLDIYPNPAHNTFTMSFGELNIEDGILNIYDVMGREVYTQTIRNLAQSEIRNSFSPGVYFVKVRAGERVWMEKVVVE